MACRNVFSSFSQCLCCLYQFHLFWCNQTQCGFKKSIRKAPNFAASHTKEVLYSPKMNKPHIKSMYSDRSFMRSACRPCLRVLDYTLPVGMCVSEQACAMMCIMSCVKTTTLPQESWRKHRISQNCRPLLGTKTADIPSVFSRLFSA